MNSEFENEYYVPKTYAETAMEVIKNDWEDRKSKEEHLAFDRYVFAKALKKSNDSPYYQADRHGRPISKLQRYTEFSLMADYERMKNPQHSSERNCEVEMHQVEENPSPVDVLQGALDHKTEYDPETGEMIEKVISEEANGMPNINDKDSRKKSKKCFKAKGSVRNSRSCDLPNNEIDIEEEL